MNRNILSFIIGFVGIFLISCEKDITLDLKEPETGLCLDCIMEAGNDSVVMYVTKVQSVENTGNIVPVEDAEIFLQKDDEILTGIEHKGNGKYLLAHSPEEGKTYKIQVNVDGHKPLSAVTKVPLRPLAEAQYLTDTIPDEKWEKGYYTVSKIFVELKDHSSKDYYWLLRAYIRNIGGVSNGSFSPPYQTDNLLFDEFNRYYYQDYNYPFTNFEYVGALRLDDEVIKNNEISFSISAGKQSTVFVINADESFDKYYKSSIKQFLAYEYDQLPVFEPVQIYSNVENGFGIFGSIAVARFYFDK